MFNKNKEERKEKGKINIERAILKAKRAHEE
jgi:hypothetical protein